MACKERGMLFSIFTFLLKGKICETKNGLYRYGKAFKEMGLTVFTGDGGFYHWMELPKGLNADEFNKRLFKKGAAILKGSDCDMGRPHAKGDMPSAKSMGDPDYVTPYTRMFRFSFGPLLPETFESDIKLFREVYEAYKKDGGVY